LPGFDPKADEILNESSEAAGGIVELFGFLRASCEKGLA
jgi:hypothetical protein